MENVKEALFTWSPWLFGNLEPLNQELRGIRVTQPMRYLLNLAKEERRILVIRGPRGVGKTTALKWIARRLIDDGKHVMFLGLEWSLYGPEFLNSSLNYFIKEIAGSLPRTARDVVIILDEIQNLDGWWKVVKEWYDLNNNIKFILAGSSSTILAQQSFASLSHRAVEVKFYPLKFSNVLLHNARKDEISSEQVIRLRGALDWIMNGKTEKLKELHEELEPFKPVIKRELKEFMRKGGYPYSVFKGYDPSFFDSILSEVMLKDLRARKSTKIMLLLRRLAVEKCDKNVEGISRDLGEKGASGIYRWLEGLQNSAVIDVIYKFDPSGKTVGGRFKAYFVDRGMKNAVLNNFGHLSWIDEENDAEAVVYDVLKRWAYRNGFTVWFWKDRKGREIDFVVEKGEKGLLVESKYSSDPEFPKAEIKGPMKRFGRVLVTKDTFKIGETIMVPLWMFALFV